MMTTAPHFSFVSEYPAADPVTAKAHFLSKLAFETDPADVHLDLTRSPDGFVVVDVRSVAQFDECHVAGAISLPNRTIGEHTVAHLDRDATIVTYCWGPGCNASTKAAAKLAALGFKVKEMVGGIEYWRREGLPVEGNRGDAAPLTR